MSAVKPVPLSPLPFGVELEAKFDNRLIPEREVTLCSRRHLIPRENKYNQTNLKK